jgi:GNAT superfamily N-acetyltransferase
MHVSIFAARHNFEMYAKPSSAVSFLVVRTALLSLLPWLAAVLKGKVGYYGGGVVRPLSWLSSMTTAATGLSLAARRRRGRQRPTTTRPALLLLQHEKIKKKRPEERQRRNVVQVHRRILSPRQSIMDRMRNGTLLIDDPVLYYDMNESFGQTHDDDGRVVHYLATSTLDDDSKVIGMVQALPGWQQAWDDGDDDTTTEENMISLLPLSADRGHVGTTALWLENIMVAPQYRRLGVATALLQAIENEAYELAANMTTAMTAEDETTTAPTVVELRLTSFRTKSALGLYRSLGYRVVVATPPRWHDDDDRADDDNNDRVADDDNNNDHRERRQRRRLGGSNNTNCTTTNTKTASSSILFAKQKKDWWSWTCDAKYPTTLDLVKEVRIV